MDARVTKGLLEKAGRNIERNIEGISAVIRVKGRSRTVSRLLHNLLDDLEKGVRACENFIKTAPQDSELAIEWMDLLYANVNNAMETAESYILSRKAARGSTLSSEATDTVQNLSFLEIAESETAKGTVRDHGRPGARDAVDVGGCAGLIDEQVTKCEVTKKSEKHVDCSQVVKCGCANNDNAVRANGCAVDGATFHGQGCAGAKDINVTRSDVDSKSKSRLDCGQSVKCICANSDRDCASNSSVGQLENRRENQPTTTLEMLKVGNDFSSGLSHSFSPPDISTISPSKHQSFHFGKSLPKLTLAHFDGDPLKWIDWSGMFRAMIHAAPISDVEKMTHLQHSVTHRAKAEIAGFGYDGSNYLLAYSTLEERFGKRQFVVKAHLDKLSKLQPIVDGNRNSVFNLASTVRAVVCAFESLGYHGDLEAVSNCDSVISKMSDSMRFRWARHLAKGRIEIPTLRTINDWLQDEVKAQEWLSPLSRQSRQQSSGRSGNSASTFIVSNESESYGNSDKSQAKVNCPLDNGQHDLANCTKFKSMSISERVEVVQKHKLCFVCFRRNHWVRKCKAKRCGIGNCRKNHHALLHRQVDSSNTAMTGDPLLARAEHTAAAHNHKKSSVLLQVLPVRVHGPAGVIDTLAMLDMGSTCSLLATDTARIIGVSGESQKLDLSGIRERSLITSFKADLAVSSGYDSEVHQVKNVWVVDKLNLPKAGVDMSKEKSRWSHLKDIDLPSTEGKRVTLLLGSDAFDLIKPIEVRSGQSGTPHGVNTPLGWTVVGSVPGLKSYFTEQAFHVHIENPDDKLGQLVKEWWTTESFGCSHDVIVSRSIEDRHALEILERSTHKVGDKYETALLWKEKEVALPNNRILAENRLKSLERRLNRDPDLKAAYAKTIQTDLDKGYLRKLSPEEANLPVKRQWFLPHHPVINPNKPGKIRRVFDAAAKFDGVSLNDCLVTGPNLLKPLNAVLMRFRENSVALSADIEGMYSQVKVPEEDQSVLRFLWREDMDKPPDVYQFQRHIFGAKSSPTSAIYVLQQTARDNQHIYPEAAEIVRNNFYMDDGLFSVDRQKTGIDMYHDLVSMLSNGGFHLTKWSSCSPDVLRAIPVEELAPTSKYIHNECTEGFAVERVLGVRWDTSQDSFIFDIGPGDGIFKTPRQVLSKTASIFDPLGMLAPVTLIPKLLMQELWRKKLNWDDKISDEDQQLFKEWLESLQYLKSLAVPRFYRDLSLKPTSVQLHVFCDASEKAFSAVLFFRFTYENGRVNCRFVIGKSRVAPVKPLTIPRLELQAAVLGVRLAKTVLSETTYKVSETHYWSDSSTVIQWITATTGRHPTFIASRIAEILDSSMPHQWHHVPGRLNVADDGSRGLPADKVTNECRWFNGPAFLLMPTDMWPDGPHSLHSSSDASRVQVFTGHATGVKPTDCELIEINRFSNWSRLWRTAAWVLRFIHNCRHSFNRKVGYLRADEKSNAETLLIRQAQRENFGREIENLNAGKPVSNQSPLRKLAPYVDDDGIVRSRGRIGKSSVPYDVRYPVILSPKSGVTKLIILQAHLESHHEGLDFVRNALRQRFWIIKARSAIRRVIHSCMYCRRRNAMPITAIMGDLPGARVEGNKHVFHSVGIDYFGPIQVRKFRRVEKRYGCLFICMATKAIHLEMASSLDTDSFIMALRRFICRRGHPRHIYSDNGTNFVGAERELRECLQNFNQQRISDSLLQQNIQWHFNPPAAPHFGGLWERMVKSVKRAMRAILVKEQVVLTDEVLNTVFVETESLLNSRPLTPMSDDPLDLNALTPNHFLLGRSNPNLPPDVFYENDITSRRRWRQSQILIEHLWKRWSHEYLPTLGERKKWWKDQGRNIKEGDLVLMIDRCQPRGSWLLGRVMKLYPGDDGVVRVVDIMTKHGQFKRPVAKLASLEE